MGLNNPLLDPFNNVVFERTLDDLMEEIRSNQLIDVRSRKIGSKRLRVYLSVTYSTDIRKY